MTFTLHQGGVVNTSHVKPENAQTFVKHTVLSPYTRHLNIQQLRLFTVYPKPHPTLSE